MLTNARRILLLASLTAASLWPAPAQAQTAATLRYQFKEGRLTHYVMEQKMNMKMDVAGQEIEMKMTQTMEIQEKIVSVEKDGSAKVIQKIDRWRMEMDSPMGKIEIDSDKKIDEDDPIAQAFGPVLKELVGVEIPMTMNPRGEMSNLKVPDKLVEAIKKVPGAGETFSEDSLKQMMGQGALVFPKESITKGKSWKNKIDQKMPFGAMEMTTTNTYEGPTKQGDRTLEKINQVMDMKVKPAEDTPLPIKVNVEKSKGFVLFDNAAGRLVESQTQQVMVMQIEVGDQTVNQRIESTSTYKVKK